jgi:tRNA pseudouridine38-40 synthase
VAAGAISKANADDPKKSSLIRCARTDKGVHAAGNLISLKLIIEDPDIVKKINQNLSPQIRVFGLVRTSGSFSAYQFCDSRIYEYLIPSHAFVPPHPKTFLGRKLIEIAEESNDTGDFQKRQAEVASFWEDVEDQYIKPILAKLDPSARSTVLQAFYEMNIDSAELEGPAQYAKSKDSAQKETLLPETQPGMSPSDLSAASIVSFNQEEGVGHQSLLPSIGVEVGVDVMPAKENCDPLAISEVDGPTFKAQTTVPDKTDAVDGTLHPRKCLNNKLMLEQTVRELKTAHIAARKAYRIQPERLARVRSVLSRFVGSHNFHNYTVNKAFADASAKRVIKTFVVHKDPIIINDTEWLSLKVHGQSFMMHQIRKMVSMTALVVRCGCDEGRLEDSYKRDRISIPKAPGLGLLLERPVFDTYNDRFAGQRERLDFAKYETEMEQFKQREIYERIFREEERDNQSALPFHSSQTPRPA